MVMFVNTREKLRSLVEPRPSSINMIETLRYSEETRRK